MRRNFISTLANLAVVAAEIVAEQITPTSMLPRMYFVMK
jgi:hypothetical protein